MGILVANKELLMKFNDKVNDILNEGVEEDILQAIDNFEKENKGSKQEGLTLSNFSAAFMMIDKPLPMKLDKLRKVLNKMYHDDKIRIGQGKGGKLFYSSY